MKLDTDLTNLLDTSKQVYYQSGMLNDKNGVDEEARFLSEELGEPIGKIHNNTHGLVGDVVEYVPKGYEIKDVLNAYMYEALSKKECKSLVVMFSAGNEDAYKALKVLSLEGRHLGGKVDFVSVGSPRGLRSLREAGSAVGANVLGQYNDWKDPVTHPKLWATGFAVLVGYGLIQGGAVGVALLGSSGSGGFMGSIPNFVIGAGIGGSIGAGIGGGIGNLALKNHGFDTYLRKDVKGVRTRLEGLVLNAKYGFVFEESPLFFTKVSDETPDPEPSGLGAPRAGNENVRVPYKQ